MVFFGFLSIFFLFKEETIDSQVAERVDDEGENGGGKKSARNKSLNEAFLHEGWGIQKRLPLEEVSKETPSPWKFDDAETEIVHQSRKLFCYFGKMDIFFPSTKHTSQIQDDDGGDGGK